MTTTIKNVQDEITKVVLIYETQRVDGTSALELVTVIMSVTSARWGAFITTAFLCGLEVITTATVSDEIMKMFLVVALKFQHIGTGYHNGGS